ncbi:hypothetical protein EDC05_006195, partial [Coemansia umbellata]
QQDAEAVDTVGRFFTSVANQNGSDLAKQVCTSEWLRMMSEKDDVRGRHADPRLCDIALLQKIDTYKSSLAKVPTGVFNSACIETNPYAELSKTIFVSPVAVLFGHLDFTFQVASEYLKPGAQPLRFVDLGSSNGGCSEYILWKANKQPINGSGDASSVHGWYFAQNSQSTHNIHVVNLDAMLPECKAKNRLTIVDNTAGITNTAEANAFACQVLDGTSSDSSSKGVDLVIGELCYEQSDLASDHEKRHYAFVIAQAAVALQVLRRGGTFVFKMFDTTTPLSAEILFLIYSCFGRTAVVRSLVSRPTSTERYVICNRLVADTKWAVSHLQQALTKINSGQFKLSHIVSWTKVSAEKEFIEALSQINIKLAHTQLQALRHLESVISKQQNAQTIPSSLQKNIANKCLANWDLPLLK